MIEINKIYNIDCIEGTRLIPDSSVDAIICDLPYNQTHNQWDKPINLDALWEQYERIVKHNGAIILFAQGMFSAQLMMSRMNIWRYNLIWKKGNRVSGFLNAKRMPLRNHEDILVFYRSLPTYNPQMHKGKPLHSRGRGKHKQNINCYRKYKEADDSRAGSTDKYPISVLNFDRPHPPIHPTQKPVDLIRYLIRTYSNEGDIILDNCMGSGTTAVAAIKENRHFIGFELNKEYYDKACMRIEKEQQQLSLF